MQLNDKIVLVTGANRGLGFGFVQELLKKDAIVIATCRNPETSTELQDLKSGNTKKLFLYKLDISDDSSIDLFIEEFSKNFQNLDILINNAGVNSSTLSPQDPGKLKELAKLDRNLLLQMFNINTVSPIILVKKLLSFLEKANEALVVNISSMRASFQDKNDKANYAYSSSKVALNMMTRDLTFDLNPYKIKCFCIEPGWVKTDMNKGIGEIKPQESAKKILEVIENFQEAKNGKFLGLNGDLYPL